MTDTPTPLPCPFCGNTPAYGAHLDRGFVECVSHHCGVCPTVGRNDSGATGGCALAIADWNTRAPHPDLARMREALEEIKAHAYDATHDRMNYLAALYDIHDWAAKALTPPPKEQQT